MYYKMYLDMKEMEIFDSERGPIVSDAKVLVISPVSNNSFIESVRLRSIRKALWRLRFDIFSSFAISSREKHAILAPFSGLPCPHPFNST